MSLYTNKIIAAALVVVALSACSDKPAHAQEQAQPEAAAPSASAPTKELPVALQAIEAGKEYKFPGVATQIGTLPELSAGNAPLVCDNITGITEVTGMQLTAGGIDYQLMVRGGTKDVKIQWDKKAKKCSIKLVLSGDFMDKHYDRVVSGTISTVVKASENQFIANAVIAQ